MGTTRDAGSTSSDTSTSEGHSGGRRECPLCLQDVSDDLFPTLLSCPHSACLSCLRQYLKVEITESRVNISCPQCNELMHPTGWSDFSPSRYCYFYMVLLKLGSVQNTSFYDSVMNVDAKY